MSKKRMGHVRRGHVRQNVIGHNIDPYEELGIAVIRQAVIDYRIARRKLVKHPEDPVPAGEVDQIRKFFYSQYFNLWTDADGVAIYERMERKVDKECEELRRELEKKRAEAERLQAEKLREAEERRLAEIAWALRPRKQRKKRRAPEQGCCHQPHRQTLSRQKGAWTT